MKLYLRILAILYGVGAILHLADILDLRLLFSEMDLIWKSWIVFLFIGDSIAAIGLWKQMVFGEIAFLIIAATQLVAYLGFQGGFGDQSFLVLFHVFTVGIYLALKIKNKLKPPSLEA